MFEWVCPECYTKYTYNGILTDRAVGKCSKPTCERYKVSTKIWQHKVPEFKKKIVTTGIPDIPNIPRNIPIIKPFVKTMITAMTYAINTIKNKKQVRDQDENSTWYQYYKDWSRAKEILKMMDQNGNKNK